MGTQKGAAAAGTVWQRPGSHGCRRTRRLHSGDVPEWTESGDSKRRSVPSPPAAPLAAARRQKCPRCPSEGACTSKTSCIHTTECYAAWKRTKTLTHTMTWVNPRDTVPREVRQTQKDERCLTPLRAVSRGVTVVGREKGG